MQKKTILSALLSVSILLSCSTVAFASDATGTGSTFKEAGKVYVGVKSEVMTTTQTPGGALEARSKDMKSSTQKKDTYSVGKSSTFSTAEVTWNYLPNPFYVYNQVTSYNCGPASAQAALRYINGSTPPQSDIATGCNTTTSGTYIANMASYLNSQQSTVNYVPMYQQSSSTMEYCLGFGIVTEQIPPIIGLAFSSSDGWLYTTGGHFMSVYGAMSDNSYFALGDPWVGYSGSGLSSYSWSYSKPSSTLYTAYNSVNIGFIY